MDNSERTANMLTKNGCKNTKSRRAIVFVLEKAVCPLTVEDIFLGIKELGGSTNLSTVYRNLELMESKGLVDKTIINDSKARYKLSGEGHRHHIICTNCHKMIPIEDCPIKSLERDVCEKTEFDITGHKLELYGLCPKCKEE